MDAPPEIPMPPVPEIPPAAIIAGTWCKMRETRAKLLADSDWTQTRDCPLDESKINEWAVYRQTLRDIPSAQTIELNENNIPNKIVWPTPPQ